MTNVEGTLNDRMTKRELDLPQYGFRHSFVIRHSSFDKPDRHGAAIKLAVAQLIARLQQKWAKTLSGTVTRTSSVMSTEVETSLTIVRTPDPRYPFSAGSVD